ncbi:hypothetical protein [Bifidobacterium aquikefiricola]|uniref:Uncharacterized protein n=1 Tax=Bifidobacterium aquikefiricola TaxID=3059038 RepID=A0AB39U7N2_9BIFI
MGRIQEILATIHDDVSLSEQLSQRMLTGIVDGHIDYDVMAHSLADFATEHGFENPPSPSSIKKLMLANSGKPLVEFHGDQLLGDFHLGNIAKVNVACRGAFIARLAILASLHDELWVGDWIAVNNDTGAYLDSLRLSGRLDDGDSFIVRVDIGTGPSQYGPMLVYNEGLHNASPRYAANFTVSGTTCDVGYSRQNDSVFG